jgi:hypothetical protein
MTLFANVMAMLANVMAWLVNVMVLLRNVMARLVRATSVGTVPRVVPRTSRGMTNAGRA